MNSRSTDAGGAMKPESSPASRTRQDDVDDADHIKTMEMMNGGHMTAGRFQVRPGADQGRDQHIAHEAKDAAGHRPAAHRQDAAEHCLV